MMNKVLLIGRLARDPELREFSNGNAIATLRVMTNRSWRDTSTGEMRTRADGHTVVIHSEKVARRLVGMLAKGHLVYVEGMLEHRQWQGSDGQTRYATEVCVRPYLGTVRKMPGMASTTPDTTPSQTAPQAAPANPADHDTPGAQVAAPPEATPTTAPAAVEEGHEIDFFADAGLSDTSPFEF